jgi:hypothetical protein
LDKLGLQRLRELQRELLQKIETVRQTRDDSPKAIEINELHKQEASLLDDLARVEREIVNAVGTVFVRSSDAIV